MGHLTVKAEPIYAPKDITAKAGLFLPSVNLKRLLPFSISFLPDTIHQKIEEPRKGQPGPQDRKTTGYPLYTAFPVPQDKADTGREGWKGETGYGTEDVNSSGMDFILPGNSQKSGQSAQASIKGDPSSHG